MGRIARTVTEGKRIAANQAAQLEKKERHAAWTQSVRKALDEENYLDMFACFAILQMEGGPYEGEDLFHLAFPYLRVSANEASEGRRLCALEGLAFGNACYASTILSERLYDKKESQKVRVKAAKVIGRGDFKSGMPTLLQHLEDPDSELRTAVCNSIGSILQAMKARGSEFIALQDVAIPSLLRVLDDDRNIDALVAAMQALGNTDDLHVLRRLQEISSDPKRPPDLKQAAAEAAALIRSNAFTRAGAAI